MNTTQKKRTHRRSTTRRRHNNQASPLMLAAYSIGIVLGLLGLGYAGYATLDDPIADANGCYAEAPSREVILAIDASEPRWNAEQQRALQRFVSQVYTDLGFNERLSVYTTEGDAYAALLSPQVQVCGTAKDPRDLAAIGVSAPSVGYLRKEAQRLFEKVLAPELAAILAIEAEPSRTQRNQSPILEMLQSLSRMPSFNQASRLIVASDFLQNSDTARFCVVQNDMPRFDVFKERRNYQRVRPESFEGIDVDFLMLQRAGYGGAYLPHCRDEEELQDFFRDYAEHNGARSTRLTRLRHGFGG